MPPSKTNLIKKNAQNSLKQLVEKFHEHFDTYKESNYSESQLRVDFLNEFFRILGWDVANTSNLSPSVREVVTEDSVEVEGRSKSPDYSFRFQDGKRAFFAEAKKPNVNIYKHSGSSFQLRRYGWSADLDISVLTSFEYFAVYDCALKPSPGDKSSYCRLKIIHYEDYIKEFDYIWDNFSRESVLRGSLRNFVGKKRSKKGTASVDREFVSSLDKWRISLAKDINELNKLDEDQLNYVVQQIIDRIIFLRIAEDRSVETYGQIKLVLDERNSYLALTRLFEKADIKYNSGLFKKDNLFTNLKISNDVLHKIINGLYYPISPYEFSVLPIEILGKAYEQFLGKKITLTTGSNIKIENKPGIRKSGGVYYTPKYVVDNIVKRTVGELCRGKTPEKIAELKFLDPASGSGSFLIGAYEFLLDWHRDYFAKHRSKYSRKKLSKILTPAGELTVNFRKQVLLNNIFGVDIDASAVEVTKLSLLLKCLEGETKETLNAQLGWFSESILPTLDSNIRCGNSLIDYDIYTHFSDFEEDIKIKRRINAFTWKVAFKSIIAKGGFDAVIGNPPYDVMEKDRKGKITPHKALRKYIEVKGELKPALGGKLNLYRFFVVKFINLTRQNGRFGLIIPMSILADISCKNTRAFMLENTVGPEFDCFPQKDIPSKRIFFDAKLSTVVITGARANKHGSDKNNFVVRTHPENRFDEDCKEVKLTFKDLSKIDPNSLGIPMIDQPSFKLLKKIHTNRSISSIGKQNAYISVRRGEINQTNFKSYIQNAESGGERLIKGVQIGKFRFNKVLSQGKVQWFNEEKYNRKMRKPISISEIRRIATQRITGVDEGVRVVATIIEPKAYFADSTNSITVSEKSPYSLEFLLGLLNSKIYQWRFKITSTNNNVGTNEIENLPILSLKNANKDVTKCVRRIEDTVLKLISLNEKLLNRYAFRSGKLIPLQTNGGASQREMEQAMDELNFYEDRLNRDIYKLFRATEADIKVVEGGSDV